MNLDELIGQMTLEEKASLLSGENFWNTKAIKRLGIPSMMLTDGPHGVRKQGGKADHLGLNKSIPATCFPPAATLANSWDTALLHRVGERLGLEAAGEHVGVLLGPGLNIKRNPLCGRNFEYFSEDPHVTGQLASSMVRGIQSSGIAASPKHYAVNSQEHLRMSINEIVDERALRELYLEGFRQAVVDGEAKVVMTSYNKVNGEFANENTHLMRDILYGEWEYPGMTVTDWGGNNDRVRGLIAGNQLEMPSTSGITDAEVVAAVRAGTLDEAVVDDAVTRLLRVVFETGAAVADASPVDHDAQHREAVDAARKSMVLLKNEGNVLPLRPGLRVAIIGDFAKNPRYQGAGSSLVNAYQLDDALSALEQSSIEVVGYEQGFKRLGGESKRLRKRALALAGKVDTVVLFLGLDEGSEAEGIDRESLRIHNNQLQLMNELRGVVKNIVVVLAGGGVIELPFEAKADAILHSYLGGQGGGTAVKELLLGEANPSGKLTETYPLRYTDVPSSPYYPGREATSEHRESIFIGYRYYDTAGVPVRYPFGYGLSYTTFAYSDLEVSEGSVLATITNTGSVAGEEIVQLYIRPVHKRVFRADRELKAFAKVALKPGESARVELPYSRRDLAYYNVANGDWSVQSGDYELQVAASLLDVRLSGTVSIVGDDTPHGYDEGQLAKYYATDLRSLTAADFHALLDFTPEPTLWDRSKPLGLDDTIAQGQYRGLFGRAFYGVLALAQTVLRAFKKPMLANNVMFLIAMPFRKIERFTGGKVSQRGVSRLLKWVNGRRR
ncbi:beta-glucosidase family protein [Lysinibacter cavernae]|uniref:Beta-glucosidase n=1 Tax=Lysinibacter cavernae TaxID=1640652 RepID=A0A7X5R424_9MICO|nr:glycoside hydrolase family 3 C-terminal domain-containing protein [Lysinibacter cavernae]NIH55304.1 beta-glucosidase [Lysinibacter cavernae]